MTESADEPIDDLDAFIAEASADPNFKAAYDHEPIEDVPLEEDEPATETPAASPVNCNELMGTLNATPDIDHDDSEMGDTKDKPIDHTGIVSALKDGDDTDPDQGTGSMVDEIVTGPAPGKGKKGAATKDAAGSGSPAPAEGIAPDTRHWHIALQGSGSAQQEAYELAADFVDFMRNKHELPVPPCWYLHGGLVSDILGLRESWYEPSKYSTSVSFKADWDVVTRNLPWVTVCKHQGPSHVYPPNGPGEAQRPTFREYVAMLISGEDTVWTPKLPTWRDEKEAGADAGETNTGKANSGTTTAAPVAPAS